MRKSKAARSAFSRFSLAWTRAFSASFFAFFLSLYRRADDALQSGAFRKVSLVLAPGKARRLAFKARVSRTIRQSVILTALKNSVHFLLSLKLHNFGTFLFVCGFSDCLIYLARRFLSGFGEADAGLLLCGLSLMLGALPLFSRRRTLESALIKSRFIGSFLENAVLLREDELPASAPHSAAALCVLAAILVSLGGALIGPLTLLAIVLSLILALLALSKPEFGGALILFFYPFLSEKGLCILSLFVTFCFLVKVLQGRRNVHFDLLDLAFFSFFLFLLLSGIFSAFGGFVPALTITVLAANVFLIRNFSRRREVLTALFGAFLSGESISAALRILYSVLPARFLPGGVHTFFEIVGAHTSAALLACAVPLALLFCRKAKKAKGRLLAFASLLLLAGGLWFSSSLTAALGAVVGALCLIAAGGRGAFFALTALLLGTAVALPLIPGEQTLFLRSLPENKNLFLFSASSKLSAESFVLGLGAFTPDALSGLGTGFSGEINFFAQLLLAVGALGALLYVFSFIFSFQKAADFFFSASHNPDRILPAAPLISAFVLLVIGLKLDLLSSPRLFVLPFLFCALSACAEELLTEEDAVILNRF